MKKTFFFFAAIMSGMMVNAQESGGDHSVVRDATVNQAQLRLTTGDLKFYNTASLNSIEINGGQATVNMDNQTQDILDFAAIRFLKKGDSALQITVAKGWFETAYVEWSLLEEAAGYNVYVKGGNYADYTKIDQQLVRNYGTYGRADAVGLVAGSYDVKVVPVVNDAEVNNMACEAQGLIVKSYRRDGYAHHQAVAGIGAYNNDGSLKAGARVLYVTKNNAKTVKLSMSVGKSEEERTGIQNIIQAYEKGAETRPLAIRIIGQLTKNDMDALGSSAIGLQVKGKGQNMNLTIEGIGSDATLHGFGVLCRACKYVELRNFAVMMHPEDGISFDTDNEHLWGHNLDIFYGENKGGDKAKGDGSFDVKGTFYCTVSDNHFWDSGKCNLNSNGDEVDYVTYHHNWYDHSDSRHPRVRKSKHLHVFNNYYDGNSKYGVGSTTGSNIFVDKNYFRNCKYPMLISKQGSDINNGVGSSDQTKGTFSGEDGGIIKAYDNYMTGQKSFERWIAGDATYSKHFDAYLATSRNEQVPAEVTALQGGATYNNFDTASDFYQYSPDEAADVPAAVTGEYGAGRCEHGDFQWSFNNATEDTNYDVITELSNALKNYKTTLLGIFGDESTPSGEQGSEPSGEPTPSDTTQVEPTPQPTGTIVATFNGSSSNDMFVAATNYGDGKITYNGVYYKKGEKLDSKGSITFTPTQDYNMTLVLSEAKPGRDVKINGTVTTVTGTSYPAADADQSAYYQLNPIRITKNTEYKITKGSAESILMLIILEPVEE